MGSTRDRLLAAGGLTLGTVLAFAGSADAATLTVTNLDSSGPGSLADAVGAANVDPTTKDSIVFESGLVGTINLNASLAISGSVDITGPGADQITINGGDAHRIFYIFFNGISELFGDPVSISGLTLTHGFGDFGAGIWNRSSHLTASDLVITHSNATGDGGAIDSSGALGTMLTLHSSTLSGNTAVLRGGALDLESRFEMSDSTLVGNTVTNEGGALSLAEYGLAKIQNSTITGNVSGKDGGAIFAYAGEPNANLEIVSSTIAGNSAAARNTGGGISLASSPNPPSSPSSPLLENTIVSGNTAGQGGADLYSYAPPFDASFSLIQDTAGADITTTVPDSVITGQGPQLGPLQANGGAMPTMAPAPTSPVIDKGSAFGLGFDERGIARPIDFPGIPASSAPGADGSDIGAVELEVPLPVEPGDPLPAEPSNAFSFGKVKHDRRHGTATLSVVVPGEGTLTLGGKRVVAQRPAGRRSLFGRRARAVAGAGVVPLAVKAKGKSRTRLNRRGSAKVKATVMFTPTGGTPATATRAVRLLKKIR